MSVVTIGGVRATRIEESYEPNFDAAMFFADWRPEILAEYPWIAPDHYNPASAMLKLSVHSWLLEAGSKKILIDTCVGNHKQRPHRPKWHLMEKPYLARLAAAGVRPEEIDLVMCSHLHVDHVGWNTRLENGRWVPTFPNAKYVFSREDYDHFTAIDRDLVKGPAGGGSFRDSVLPVVEAGLAQMVSGGGALDEYLSYEPTPGHTPGSITIKLADRGQQAAFCGDVLHHALQVHHPDWNSFACGDPVNARLSRRKVLEHCAGTGARLMPAHFGQPFTCHIEGVGDGFRPRF
jgi:glyoxylase-like metal-dependent hydrolase (beta-lactamase superfamily II)